MRCATLIFGAAVLALGAAVFALGAAVFAAAAGAGALVMLRTGGGGPLGSCSVLAPREQVSASERARCWAGALSICMPGICTVVACGLGTGVLGAGALVTRGAAGGVAFWIRTARERCGRLRCGLRDLADRRHDWGLS